MSVENIDPRIIEALIAKRNEMSEETTYLKMLIYGPSGTGKTIASMQFAQKITPDNKTIEYIDSLSGWVSSKNHLGLTKRITRQKYEGLSQIEFLAKAIKQKIEPFANIGTVILDEFSSMTKQDLDLVLKTRAANDSSKDGSVPTQPDFYSNTERSRRTITELLQADVNVICVAHERIDKLNNGRVMTSPAFMPAFSEIFKQALHLIAYLSAEEFLAEDGSPEYRRSLQVHPTKSVNAKTRVGGLPVNLTLDALIPATVEWMQGARKSEAVSEVTGENIEIHPDTDTVEVSDSLEDVAISVD